MSPEPSGRVDAADVEIDPTAVVLSDTDRVETFSDGVLAIVITLLVLDVRVPDAPPGQLRKGILEQWPTYLAYVTSFLYVGVVWLNHHAVFRRIRLVDRGLHWCNLGILFTTALLPFPTAVIARTVGEGNAADERTAVVLYAFVGALLCLSWLGLFSYLGRHPELHAEDVHDRFFPRERLRAVVGVALYVVGGLLGYLAAPWLALAVFFAVPVFYGITSHGLDALPVMVRRVAPSGRTPRA